MSCSVPTPVLRSKAAAYRSFLVGKCLKMVASLTPEAWARDFVVVPLNPCRPNRAMAASTIWARRSGPDIRLPDFGALPEAVCVGESLGTLREAAGGCGRVASIR